MKLRNKDDKANLISLDRLINLFTLFFLGTLTFIVFISLPKTSPFKWWGGLLSGLSMFTILSYEIVGLTLLLFYFTKGKNKLLISFEENKKRYLIGTIVITFIIYVIIEFITNGLSSAIKSSMLIIITTLAAAMSNYLANLFGIKLKKLD